MSTTKNYTVVGAVGLGGTPGERWFHTAEGAIAYALSVGASACGPRGWLVFRGVRV